MSDISFSWKKGAHKGLRLNASYFMMENEVPRCQTGCFLVFVSFPVVLVEKFFFFSPAGRPILARALWQLVHVLISDRMYSWNSGVKHTVRYGSSRCELNQRDTYRVDH